MTWRIEVGDCRDVLRTMPAGSVHTVVTSPPYFGLRDYGTGDWEGGDSACDHSPEARGGRFASPVSAKQASNTGSGTASSRDCPCGARRVDRQIGLEPTPDEFVAALVAVFREVRRVLRDDGTVWLNLGDSYASSPPGNSDTNSSGLHGAQSSKRYAERLLAKDNRGSRTYGAGIKPKDLVGIPWMVAFALRADGWVLRSEVIWSKPNPMPESVSDRPTKAHEQIFMFSKARWTGAEEPLPMRDVDAAWLAALVDGEGSICFQDRTSEGAGQKTYSVRLSIVNTNRALLERVEQICGLAGVGSPSPRTRSSGESGRPIYAWQVTNAKAARVIAAIRPYLVAKTTQADLALYVQALNRKHTGRGGYSVSRADQDGKAKAAAACSALNRGQEVDLGWFRAVKPGRWVPLPYAYDADAIREDAIHEGRVVKAYGDGAKNGAGGTETNDRRTAAGFTQHDTLVAGRNKRSVWTVATQPYAGAHFATFPPKLIEPCILAGAPERACAVCGAPWVRVVETVGPSSRDVLREAGAAAYSNGQPQNPQGLDHAGPSSAHNRERRTLGFEPSCSHGDSSARGVVLDPFAGAGTTGLVALQHGREFVGIELSPKYAAMARDRIETAVRLGFRAPQNGAKVADGQESLFG